MSRGMLVILKGMGNAKSCVVDLSPIYTRDMIALRDKLVPMPDTSRLPQGSLPDVDRGTATQDLRVGRASFDHRSPPAAFRKKSQRMYRPVDQAADGRLWAIYDKATGAELARVRGVPAWVVAQTKKLVESQSCNLADVNVRPL